MTSFEDLLVNLRVTALCRVCRFEGFSVPRNVARNALTANGDLDVALRRLRNGRTVFQRLMAPILKILTKRTVPVGPAHSVKREL
jgi:hypothetical protein